MYEVRRRYGFRHARIQRRSRTGYFYHTLHGQIQRPRHLTGIRRVDDGACQLVPSVLPVRGSEPCCVDQLVASRQRESGATHGHYHLHARVCLPRRQQCREDYDRDSRVYVAAFRTYDPTLHGQIQRPRQHTGIRLVDDGACQLVPSVLPVRGSEPCCVDQLVASRQRESGATHGHYHLHARVCLPRRQQCREDYDRDSRVYVAAFRTYDPTLHGQIQRPRQHTGIRLVDDGACQLVPSVLPVRGSEPCCVDQLVASRQRESGATHGHYHLHARVCRPRRQQCREDYDRDSRVYVATFRTYDHTLHGQIQRPRQHTGIRLVDDGACQLVPSVLPVRGSEPCCVDQLVASRQRESGATHGHYHLHARVCRPRRQQCREDYDRDSRVYVATFRTYDHTLHGQIQRPRQHTGIRLVDDGA